MFYDFAITIPAGTAEASPVEQELDLTHGIIHRVEVQFPVGCMELAHLRLFHRRHQVWPTNIDGSFASDGYIIAFDEHYDFFEPPFDLTAIGWNDDETYQHVITVRIGILPQEIVLPFAGLGGALRRFLKLVGVGK